MLYREIIAVRSQIHTKHINTLCGQNVELLNVKPGSAYSYRWVLMVNKSRLTDSMEVVGNSSKFSCNVWRPNLVRHYVFTTSRHWYTF
jgi:hypothetical protein